MSRIKKIGSLMLKATIIAFISLLLLELIYRFQWIDFYKSEWNFQNGPLVNNKNVKQKVLVFGDSFSADANSWVTKLDKNSDFQMFNASIPGVGPETYRLISKQRINEVNPDIVILQLYVGNDLYDIRKPVNWSKLSFTRNLFWSCSNYFRTLNFFNYRMGQMSVEDDIEFNPKVDTIFNANFYSPREKLYIHGNPNYPENMINVSKAYSGPFNDLLIFIDEIKKGIPKKCEFKILLIPHCCQVSDKYVTYFNMLGSSINQGAVNNNFWKSSLVKKGFDVIDPIEALRQNESLGNSVYFANDIHLNMFGQGLVMDCVKTSIK